MFEISCRAYFMSGAVANRGRVAARDNGWTEVRVDELGMGGKGRDSDSR